MKDQAPYTFIVRPSSSNVQTKPGSNNPVLATWTISYYDDKMLFKNILLVHTTNGFCTKEQDKYFDTIGRFLSVAIDNVEFKAYGSVSDYTPEQLRQVDTTKVKRATHVRRENFFK